MKWENLYPDYNDDELRKELHRQIQINASMTVELQQAEEICELSEVFCFCPGVGVVEEKARINLERALMNWRKWKDEKGRQQKTDKT